MCLFLEEGVSLSVCVPLSCMSLCLSLYVLLSLSQCVSLSVCLCVSQCVNVCRVLLVYVSLPQFVCVCVCSENTLLDLHSTNFGSSQMAQW